MTDLPQLFEHRRDASRPDEQRPIAQHSLHVRCQFLARQDFLRQHGIFRQHQADTPVQLGIQPGLAHALSRFAGSSSRSSRMVYA
jgi:hypothetical protein